MRIAVAGAGRLGVSLLMPLLRSKHEVVAVIQNGREYRGWKRWAVPAAGRVLGGGQSMPGRARAAGVPIFWLDRMTEAALAPLAALEPDLVLVGGFGIIFKEPLLRLPRLGCVNVHSSLLPRHRGPNPFAQVILQDEKQSGVTFHAMTERIDDGDILDQTPFDLGPDDTVLSVYHRACALASARCAAVVDRIAREGIKGVPQDPAQATYDPKIKDDETWIDWTRPAAEIERYVRALSPSPMPRLRYRGETIRVARIDIDARPCDAPPGTIVQARPLVRIATGEGTVRLRVALAGKPFTWIWPSPMNRPEAGSRVEIIAPGPSVAAVLPPRALPDGRA